MEQKTILIADDDPVVLKLLAHDLTAAGYAVIQAENGEAAVRLAKRDRPDLVIFDGQGVAHPRGFGLAAHMGLLIDVPSIGCAKSRLCGEHADVPKAVGSSGKLCYNGRTVGLVVRTRRNVKPVFVSVGHRISLRNAAAWVLKTCRGYRLPEPTRQAHLLVNRLRLKARKGRG